MQKRFKQSIATILMVIMLAVMLPIPAYASEEMGGTTSQGIILEEGVYKISSAQGLEEFRNIVASDSAVKAELTGDIELGGAAWTAIPAYSGTFDGKGHIIKDLNVSEKTVQQGLFKKNEGTIKNLTVSGSVTNTKNMTGGIAGWNTGTIENCSNSAKVSSTGSYIGGIAGQNNGIIRNCSNVESVSGGNWAGGLAGQTLGTGAAIGGSYNAGPVTASGASGFAGGITNCSSSGGGNNIAVYFSYNLGNVTGGASGKAAGIIGNNGQNSTATLYLFNCYNTGTLTAGTTDPIANPNSSGTVNKINNYFLASETNAQGAVTDANLKSQIYTAKLNAGKFDLVPVDETLFYKSRENEYPILSWQSPVETEEVVKVLKAEINGTAKVGETLTVTVGGEDGKTPTEPLTYQWQAYLAGEYKNIAGAETDSYTITNSYSDTKLRIVVTGAKGSTAKAETGYIEKSEDQKILARDKALLSIPEAEGSTVSVKHITLAESGVNGSAILWSSDKPGVIATSGAVVLPESSIVTVKLTATLTSGNATDTKEFILQVYSESEAADLAYLNAAKKNMEYVQVKPVFGVDTNVNTLVQEILKSKGYSGISASIKKTDKPEYINNEGNITYFYVEPDQAINSLRFAQVPLVFNLTKGSASLEYAVNAVVNWDVDKVTGAMQAQILDAVNDEMLKGENPSLSQVTSKLILPKRLDSPKTWATVSWKSYNPDVIWIDNSAQNSADNLFRPYYGQVIRPTKDTEVKLTGTFEFVYTGILDKKIILTKDYLTTVKALDTTELSKQMKSELDSGYTAEKLKDTVTGQQLDSKHVVNDIQLLTPKNTGIPQYINYNFSVSSSNPDVIKINGYRAVVYRPLPGSEAQTVTLTVTMRHKELNAVASKEITVTVKPLNQGEIDDAIKLMDSVKANYFEGIKSENKDKNNVTSSLKPFQEAVFENGALKWIRDAASAKNCGIVPVALDGYTEAWRLFKSSESTVITHENLLFSKPKNDTEVTISSCLSSAIFEKYAEKYPQNQDFQKLYRQNVSAAIRVAGDEGPGPVEPKEFLVSFQLKTGNKNGSYQNWISRKNIKMAKGDTVLDLFKKILDEEKYTYVSHGGYISSIKSSKGTVWTEKEAGPNSGWMYQVNGVFPNEYASNWSLKNGDEVIWLYTVDYEKEPGAGHVKADEKAKSIALEAKTGKDEIAMATLYGTSLGEFLKGLSNAKGSIAELNVTAPKDSVGYSLELPKEALRQFGNTKATGLRISSELGSIELDAKAMAAINQEAGNGSATFEIKKADIKNLSEENQKLIGGHPIYQIHIFANKQKISQFEGGKLQIVLPYVLKAGEDSGKLAAFYISEDGKAVKMSGSKYDAAKQGVVFTSDHLSQFAVVHDAQNTKKRFDDVPETHWAKNAIENLVEKGILKGKTETAFAPSQEITRAEFVTILAKLGGDTLNQTESGFCDMPSSKWCSQAVTWAGKAGIVKGNEENQFLPNAQITREEMAVMIMRYGKYKNITLVNGTKGNAFSDADAIASYAKDAVFSICESGLMQGTGNHQFQPKKHATRAEAAKLAESILNLGK